MKEGLWGREAYGEGRPLVKGGLWGREASRERKPSGEWSNSGKGRPLGRDASGKGR